MYHLEILQTAKDDIQQIVDYYDDVAPFVTDYFLEELFSCFDILKKRPFLFQVKYRETRVCYLKKFPFGIHYQVMGKAIEILAVLHTSRNPDIWKNQ